MKRNTKRMLSMLLALVMLLGAVPFAAAVEATATIVADPGTTIWEGEEVDLLLSATSGATENEVWSTGELNVDMISVQPTATTTYSVTYDLGTQVGLTATKTITVKKVAGANFAIDPVSGANTGKAVTLAVSDANDSTIQWSVSGSDATITANGVFTASKAGTYTVTAKAVNNPSDDTDDVTDTETITVTDATYTLTLNNATFGLRESDPKMTYTIKHGTTNYTGAVTDVKFSISNIAVATIGETTGKLALKKAGTATVTLTLKVEGETLTDTATLTVSQNTGKITLKQDGEAFDDDSVDLDFEVVGPDKNDDVEWIFEVTALNIKSSTDKNSPYFTWKASKESDKREYETEEEGPEIEVELQAKKGYGIARIDVWADWGNADDERAEGTFYVSFYDDVNISVTLDEKVDEFDWDDDAVFSAVTVGTSKYSATQLKTANLAEILTLEAGTYIDLDEGSKANKNEDVGQIECTKSSLPDYDPDENNTYEMDDLEYLSFEADDEGTYQIEYVQYDRVSGYGDDLVIGEGTLKIIVGEGNGSGNGDINYDVKNKGEVTLDEDDFEDFWEEYCDDEDINDDLGWVVFDDYKATAINGALYAEDGDTNMKSTYKFHFDYDDDEDDGSKDFDLNEVLYKAHASKTNYIDEVDFTCYSEDGKEDVSGTITFSVGTVSEEEEEEETIVGTMSFTDVKSTDWYYNAVLYVYTNQIMAGTSNTKFEPNTKLSRAMVVTMLWRMEGEPTVTTSNFTDVKDTTSWYYQAVCWAARNGIVNGTTTTTFSPNNNITREQLAAILYRYADYKGQDTAATRALTGYPDASSVSNYATTAMKWAVTQGIISGDNAGRLNPQGTATRAEAATMFQRFLSK